MFELFCLALFILPITALSFHLVETRVVFRNQVERRAFVLFWFRQDDY